MNDRLFGTGEVAGMLGLKLRDVDYAIGRGRAGRVLHVAGRRALTAANVRQLARHFEKQCPPCCADDADSGCRLARALDIRQEGSGK